MQTRAQTFAAISGLEERPAEQYAIGDRLPVLAFAPRTIEALGELVRRCDELALALIAFGGGTMQAIGHAPERYDVAVAMDELGASVEYEPHDLTIGVEAGMRVATLAQTLGANRQFVPLDAPRPATATVGGTLAAGWAGPRRGLYGRPRDLLIGSTAVLADGTIAKAGGMVVKNVTGYDASKLYVGAIGTLGIIARANFKALPMPDRMRIAVAPLPEGTRARAIDHLAALPIEPSASLLINGFTNLIDGDDGAEGRLFIVLEGSEAVVERATRDLRSALGAAGVPQTAILDNGATGAFARMIDAYIAPAASPSLTYRSLHTAEHADSYRERMARFAAQLHLDAATIVDARNGDVTVRVARVDPNLVDDAFVTFDTALREIAPSAAIIAGDDALRATVEPWGALPPAFAKMRALKSEFDPHRILAPGRFLGRL